MPTLSALEINRRGVSAIEEALKRGPVHIIKNNRLACVVLSEEDYTKLLKQQTCEKASLWELLNNRPWEGERSKKNIDQKIQHQRENWDK